MPASPRTVYFSQVLLAMKEAQEQNVCGIRPIDDTRIKKTHWNLPFIQVCNAQGPK